MAVMAKLPAMSVRRSSRTIVTSCTCQLVRFRYGARRCIGSTKRPGSRRFDVLAVFFRMGDPFWRKLPEVTQRALDSLAAEDVVLAVGSRHVVPRAAVDAERSVVDG